MFGKEYAKHIDILLESFGEINKQYENKVKKSSTFVDKLKQAYILTFGIPEIGLQIRSLYFKKITSNLVGKKFKKILDAGSGIGIYTLLLSKNFKNSKITGIDIDGNKLKSSKLIINEQLIENAEFLYLDLKKLQKKLTYDFIVNIDVLEHIDNYKVVLKNFHNALKKEGYLYIHVPQPNQKRIFNEFKTWKHESHVREGITKAQLENSLKNLGFEIINSTETFGFFGKLSWELNHITLSENFILAGFFFPLLYFLAKIDLSIYNKNGLGIAILARKR